MTPRRAAILVLVVMFVITLCAPLLAPSGYSGQNRNSISAAPSITNLLGTDALGRDRFARLLYGMRISMLLAPAAAFLATLLAAIIGATGGLLGGWTERMLIGAIDVFLSLPWLFLLLTVRALMPLNTSSIASIMVTFLLLACLGWAASARVICASVHELIHSDFILHAHATGLPTSRIIFAHILPNLKPVLAAQFLVSVPVFILAEANLGMLGLGVSEPLPTWGNLLRELGSFSALRSQPWLWTPLATLVIVVICFQVILQGKEQTL